MKITGELLKSERIKKDLTVQDIAYALKLNSKIIAAIESGDLDVLPAKTFVRGFVKSYADYLKIDSEIVLRQFQEEMGSTRPLPKRPPPIATDEVTSKKIEHKPNEKITLETKFNKNHILAFVVVFVLVLLIAFINNKITDYKNESLSSLNNISRPGETTAPVATDASVATAQSQPQALQTSENGTPVQNVQQNTITPAEQASAVNAKPVSPNTATAPTAPKVAVATYPPPTPSAGRPVELLIEAKKDIVIEYAKGNSNQYTTIRMSPQSFQIIRSQSGLHLRTPDGSALNITVNGVLKGSAANSATPTVLSY